MSDTRHRIRVVAVIPRHLGIQVESATRGQRTVLRWCGVWNGTDGHVGLAAVCHDPRNCW